MIEVLIQIEDPARLEEVLGRVFAVEGTAVEVTFADESLLPLPMQCSACGRRHVGRCLESEG